MKNKEYSRKTSHSASRGLWIKIFVDTYTVAIPSQAVGFSTSDMREEEGGEAMQGNQCRLVPSHLINLSL